MSIREILSLQLTRALPQDTDVFAVARDRTVVGMTYGQLIAALNLLYGGSDQTAEIEALIAAHAAAGDPHPSYLTLAEADAAFLTPAEGNAAYDAIGSAAARAPVDANYLVGSAHAGLSGEIVVGTAPGGELGGTWASPTVDASHSGSTHAAVQTAAEATAASALVAHEVDTTSVHGIADTSLLALTTRKLDDFGAPDDNTDLNASVSAHGLMQKYPGGTTNFLRADGSFAAPSGGGSASDPGIGSFAPGSFTLTTGKYAVIPRRLEMTGIQRLTGEGTACLRGM